MWKICHVLCTLPVRPANFISVKILFFWLVTLHDMSEVECIGTQHDLVYLHAMGMSAGQRAYWLTFLAEQKLHLLPRLSGRHLQEPV